MAAKKTSSKKKTTTRKKTTSASSNAIAEIKEQMMMLKKEMKESSTNKLEQNVEELNEQITKMVSININLQSKMTELLIKVTDLVRENRELISLLEEASEVSEDKEGFDFENLLVEMKKIEKNTGDLNKSNSTLADYIKRLYTKNLLSKAIKGRVEEDTEEPKQKEKEEEPNIPMPGEEGMIGGL